ncbi:glycosyl transferase [Mortierella sp. NVP85]|nr:glycosyl transferase [Mortierella sp. NVP85]
MVHRFFFTLPLFQDTSEWTLDYPPFFAWFEKLLSQFAVLVDPKIVDVENLYYDSPATVYFQRTTVIVSELVLFWALQRMLTVMGNRPLQKVISWSLMLNPGLIMVDNMHFQYNGFLYGIMIHSLVDAKQGKLLRSGILFAVLLNFKHIYLYIAPSYFAFLLRAYCFENAGNSIRARSWISAFRPFRLITLGLCVIAVFAASLGPFAAMHQLPQLASRLFPFKRGLCHSYWAANFWALYSFVDRAMIILVSKTPLGQYFGLSVDASALAATTRGLVGDTAFGVLPAVTAQDTLIATVVLQIPGLISVFRKPTFERFVGSIALSAFASFLAGWHVHEKAILLCTVTMSVAIANMVGAGAQSDQKEPVLTPRDVRSFMIVSLAGYVGLWPLFFTREETLIKVLITWIWFVVVGSALDQCVAKLGFHSTEISRSMFRYFTALECLYIFGFVPAQLYVNVIHEAVFGQKTLEFLPLMITSVYSAVGVVYGWLLYSATYFSSGKSVEKRKTR